jgi:hypothetical protein
MLTVRLRHLVNSVPFVTYVRHTPTQPNVVPAHAVCHHAPCCWRPYIYAHSPAPLASGCSHACSQHAQTSLNKPSTRCLKAQPRCRHTGTTSGSRRNQHAWRAALACAQHHFSEHPNMWTYNKNRAHIFKHRTSAARQHPLTMHYGTACSFSGTVL